MGAVGKAFLGVGHTDPQDAEGRHSSWRFTRAREFGSLWLDLATVS
jgi:hypothetical protein